MGISIQSTDNMLRPQQVKSHTAAAGCSSVSAGHGPVHTDDNHAVKSSRDMYSKLEGLEEKYFETFRNMAVKVLGNMQSRTEESGGQAKQPQQHTLSQSSSETSTFVSQTI